jgi:hypothetical protein
MAVSAAKLEANRRNAAKSCGPTTQSGKDRSKLNAVKHGMRAATLVLLDEDAQALDDRKSDWAASLMPRGAAEQRIVEDAVEYTWLRDRARRAQEARLATNIVNSGVDEAIREADEVLRLGQKLFADNRGPLANYPHYDREDDQFPENVPVVSESEIVDGDPEDPQRLVLRLQAMAGGCQWMLDRWAELRSILEEGMDWQSADKLKAVRLLGRHPIEAVDDRNVLMIFVACQMMESRAGKLIPEIWNDLRKYERKQYAERLVGRGIEKLTPTDAAAARQVLYSIIDRATAQIALKAEAHRVRAEINDSLAADRLAFDDSPEAERLRRFDLACGRGLARSLDSLIKLRRAPELGDCSSSVVDGPSSVAGDTLETSVTPDETNEPTYACENVTNEVADASQRARKALKRSRIKIRSRIRSKDRRPTVDRENTTNEGTADLEIVTNRPHARENTTNEATAGCEIVMNEPGHACEIATNEPTLAADVGLESPTYMKATEQNSTNEHTDCCENVTNEPTDACENTTNEPTAAGAIVTNEATVDREIVTNEATDARDIDATEPTLAAGVGLESPTYMTAPAQKPSIEPALAALGEGGSSAELKVGMTDGDDGDAPAEIDRQKTADSNRAGLVRMVALRAEKLRELNEESRGEAKEANAGRRPRCDWHKNGEPADAPRKLGEGTKPRTMETNGAQTVGDSAELVNAVSGLTLMAWPTYG